MRLDLTAEDLKPIVKAVVDEVVARVGAIPDDRLAFNETESARLIGVPQHVLRDLRLTGGIQAKKCGKRALYTRETLVRYLSGK